MMKFFLIFLFSITINSNIESFEKKKDLRKNEKTFSGPMGMGLSKSYELKKKKICIYNTINGQKKIILDDKENFCPKNLKNQIKEN